MTSPEYQKKWRQDHPGYLQRYRQECPGYQRYLQEHSEERREYARAYYQKTKERRKALLRLWRRRFPEKATAIKNKHLALQKGAEGSFTSEGWILKCLYHGWRCFYCRTVLTRWTVTVDHRKPLSKGGSNWLANLVPACKSCNSRKGTKSDITFKEYASVKFEFGRGCYIQPKQRSTHSS